LKETDDEKMEKKNYSSKKLTVKKLPKVYSNNPLMKHLVISTFFQCHCNWAVGVCEEVPQH
jgi:hypothetical protein